MSNEKEKPVDSKVIHLVLDETRAMLLNGLFYYGDNTPGFTNFLRQGGKEARKLMTL